METIANDTLQPKKRAPSPPSGEPIEPGPSRARIADLAGDPYDVTVRCAPRYTGVADDMLVRRSWVGVARKLVDAGERRDLVKSARGGTGAQLRTQIQDEIRQIYNTEAYPLGMSVQEAADLLGITRWALYTILGGNVGGKGKRGTEPAKRADGAETA